MLEEGEEYYRLTGKNQSMNEETYSKTSVSPVVYSFA